jgi:ABC-type branched-subunit amino acid transport system permease subunit
VTGGPNGILNVDPLGFFGWNLPAQKEGLFNVAYLYVALAFFVVVFVALRFTNESRTGRAWRSLREDPLAAEMMGMPVNWLKLMAFAFGAATAALTGALATSLYASVFPQTFEFALLITIYTMVVLGGAGSMFGVVLGAIMVGALLEVLREPGDSRYVFYVVLLLGLVAAFRLTWKLAVVVGGTVAFGFALHAIAEQRFDSLVSGTTNGGGRLAGPISDWVLLPSDLGNWAPISYITLVVLALCLTLVSGWRRVALLVPTLYLASFVWENVMTEKPEPTRFIVLGVILIATMIARPEGLLGEKRVEIG